MSILKGKADNNLTKDKEIKLTDLKCSVLTDGS